MRLTRVDVRFFRSFNFDYERKARSSSVPEPWEDTEPAWHPFVRVDLEADITAVVGANEAGKSQLLRAVEAAVTGSPIQRGDFCRYSELYSVQQGEIRLPEFGGTYELTEGEGLEGVPELTGLRKFALYRPGDRSAFVVAGGQRIELSADSLAALSSALPRVAELRTDLAIPDSVSISRLAGKAPTKFSSRRRRASALAQIETVGGQVAAIAQALSGLLEESPETTGSATSQADAEFELGRQLLIDAARVAPSTFEELERAVASEKEGQVEALVGGINDAIRANLNVQRWWSQDRDFELRVEARERELAFTIQDRTGKKYSFGERSQGLRFFLSYFVQLMAHRTQGTQPDILLLDEPDAYLSSTGQQDLLRVLQDFALPEDGDSMCQVVYVTHSPFLIDKNAPYRIRVLDKGSDEEGTRVVHDAANNRYEPLRSSVGQHVAETAFIGGKNLFVEGAVEQVLLAGLSAHMAKRDGQLAGALDLNEVTIVASGGADGIPYLVYLARGRDSVKPPCVALVDGDGAGKAAELVLRRGEARKKRVLADQFIVRLDQVVAEEGITADPEVVVKEIEDLYPVVLARRAALNYLARFVDLDDVAVADFTEARIRAALGAGGLWSALDETFRSVFPGEHLEKVGLARELVRLLDVDPEADGADELRTRFGLLIARLSLLLEDADRAERSKRSENRLERAVGNFEADHPRGIKKLVAQRLLRDIDAALRDMDHSAAARISVEELRLGFELDDLANAEVADFDGFRDAVVALRRADRYAYQEEGLADPSSTVSKPPAAPKKK